MLEEFDEGIRKKATLCFTFSIFALMLAIMQVYFNFFFIMTKGINHQKLAICLWLGCPIISGIFSIYSIVFFFISKGDLFKTRRRIGLVLSIIAIPINVLIFAYCTFAALIS